jgi:outer membrane protein TolC
VAEVRALLQEWKGNRARLKRYDESTVPLSAERTQAAVAAYRGGGGASGGTLGAVLEARRGELDVRMERLRLEMDTARLWVQLNYLTSSGEQP